jgi:hypothetical protein
MGLTTGLGCLWVVVRWEWGPLSPVVGVLPLTVWMLSVAMMVRTLLVLMVARGVQQLMLLLVA